MQKSSKIYLAGHLGLVGSAIHRKLNEKGYTNIVTRTIEELDLIDQEAVAAFFHQEKPEYVFLAAAKVGGIIANNTYRGEFIFDNLQIQNNVIYFSYLYDVKKLLFLGSSCIYPKDAPQPMKEEYLLTGPLEYTNEPYAIAKIAGIKMCESYNLQYGTNFIPVMPTNLYGPNDNYDLEKSHVLPALIRKMLLGKAIMEADWDFINNDVDNNPVGGVNSENSRNEILGKLLNYGIVPSKGNRNVTIHLWGTGSPRREFLHSDDLADACVFLMENRDFTDTYQDGEYQIRNTHINIGTGKDISIKELALLVKDLVGFKGNIEWDTTKPGGTARKLMDVSKLNNLGWKEKIGLKEGIKKVLDSYINISRTK